MLSRKLVSNIVGKLVQLGCDLVQGKEITNEPGIANVYSFIDMNNINNKERKRKNQLSKNHQLNINREEIAPVRYDFCSQLFGKFCPPNHLIIFHP